MKFCPKCGTQIPEGGVCLNGCAGVASQPQLQPQQVAPTITAAEVGAFAGKLSATADSAIIKHISLLLKITGVIVFAWVFLGGFHYVIRFFDDISFVDGLGHIISSFINGAERGLMLFGFALIIDYLGKILGRQTG
ncbi:MAG: hypothetical protein FWF76_06195 [Oscillospiraceae bacterium]|nr:hypothetical protein [Oscillospiraceae bacterium]